MKKSTALRIAGLLLVLCSLAWPQNFITDRAVAPTPIQQVSVLAPISYGQVRVCTAADINLHISPCPDVATITDTSGNPLTIAGGNFGQITTDVVGRFSFGCTSANYLVQVAASSSNTPTLSYPMTCPSGGGIGSVIATPNQTTVTTTTTTNQIGISSTLRLPGTMDAPLGLSAEAPALFNSPNYPVHGFICDNFGIYVLSPQAQLGCQIDPNNNLSYLYFNDGRGSINTNTWLWPSCSMPGAYSSNMFGMWNPTLGCLSATQFPFAFSNSPTYLQNTLAATPANTTIYVTVNQTLTGDISVTQTGITVQCLNGAAINRTVVARLLVSGPSFTVRDCIFDGGSLTTMGQALFLTGTKATVKNNVFQNYTGTAGSLGNGIVEMSGATDIVITGNRFVNIVDHGVFGIGNTQHVVVSNNDIDTTAISGAVIVHDIAFHSTTASTTVSDITVTGNIMRNGGGYCVEVGSFGGNNAQRSTIVGNKCLVTKGFFTGGYSAAGAGIFSITGNVFDANGFTSANANVCIEAAVAVNDGNITGNTCNDGTSVGGIAIDMAARVSVTGNVINGFQTGATNFGIHVVVSNNIVLNTTDNIISSNVINFPAAGAGLGIWQQCNFAGATCSRNTYIGNEVNGPGTTGIGIQLEHDAGTASANNVVTENSLYSLSGGIVNGTNVTSTFIGPNSMVSVTTPLSGSGTQSPFSIIGSPVQVPAGTTSIVGLQGSNAAGANSGWIFPGGQTTAWLVGGTKSLFFNSGGFHNASGGAFIWSSTVQADGAADTCFDRPKAGIIRFDNDSGCGNGQALYIAGNTCRVTADITLPVNTATTVCTWSLPAVAQAWAWQCTIPWAITAGTGTNTLAIIANPSQTPTGATNGTAEIKTTNTNTATEQTTAVSASGGTTLLTSPTITPGATVFQSSTSGTLLASATAGTFSIQMTAAGTTATAAAKAGAYCTLQ